MVKPSDLVAALVAKLKLIPGLVTLMGADASNISAYADIYPQNVNLPRAILKMKSPSTLVAYRRLREEGGIIHVLTIFVRPAVDGSLSDLYEIFVEGIPTGQPLALVYATVDDNLEPMVIEGEWGPVEDSEGTEYLELNVSFKEKWG